MKPKNKVRELEKQLRSQPESLKMQFKLARALAQVGSRDRALELFLKIALTHRDDGRLDDADVATDEALLIDPNHEGALALRTELARARTPPSKADDLAYTTLRGAAPIPRERRASSEDDWAPKATLAGSGEHRRPGAKTTEMATPTFAEAEFDDVISSAVVVKGEPAGDTILEAEEDETVGLANRPQRLTSETEAAAPRARQAKAKVKDDEEILSDYTISEDLPSQSLDLPASPWSSTTGRKLVTNRDPVDPSEFDFIDGTDPELGEATRASRPDSVRRRRDKRVEQAANRTPADSLADRFDADSSDARDATASVLASLPGLNQAARRELMQRARARHFAPGEVIIREGEPGHSCFVVIRGTVRVLKRDPIDPRGDLVEVTRLEAGALFGEFALLSDRRRHATCQALDACDLYEIPRRVMFELAARNPEINPRLQEFFRKRMLSNLVKTAPLFHALDDRAREDLLSRFEPVEVLPGAVLVEQGERAGGFYVIQLGSVDITKMLADGRKVLIATLGEGAYFGELSLLRGDVARASVVATGALELVMLSPKKFYDVVSNNPILWEQIRAEADRRELEMAQIIAGMTDVV
jgi:CRP-like cAMP-binding protein